MNKTDKSLRIDFLLTIIGIIIVYLSKMWFLDRMVWIFEDMKKKQGNSK